MDPKFLSPDGQYRTVLSITTSTPVRFYEGLVGPSVIDVEVSIQGQPYTNDPDLVFFDGDRGFRVPNPSSFPTGLDLQVGPNTVAVRSVYAGGSRSGVATATVVYQEEAPSNIEANPPTGITVERLPESVILTVERIPVTLPAVIAEDNSLVGYNVYASTQQGGGTVGYSRINLSLVTDFTGTTRDVPIATLEASNTLAPGATAVRVTSTQEDQDQNTVSVAFDETVPLTSGESEIYSRVELYDRQTRRFFSFEHDRSASAPTTIFNGTFSSLPDTDPLYYVVTAVYFDPTTGLEVESSYSPEVSASPIRVSTDIGVFPVVKREDIVKDMVLSIFQTNPSIAITPGSVLRDTVIDPVSSEVERLRFLVDFLYRSSSFGTLLQVDDPRQTGSSVQVPDSAYKQALRQALFLPNDRAVQNVIDRAFEKLASNYGITRLPGRRSQGELTFYLRRAPDRTYQIPLGTVVPSGRNQFRTLRGAVIPFENSAAYFNPSNGRYEVRVPVQAALPGTSGNLAPRQIDATVNGLGVVNESRIFGGSDLESNTALAVRAMNRLASVDSGTRAGYYEDAVAVPGVVEVNVVDAGSPLMQRDYDPATQKHYGGKVDIWVQGDSPATITDTFAFTFQTARNQQFLLIGPPEGLEFQSTDTSLTPVNPLVEMVNRPDLGLGLRNASTGMDFDLTGVTVTGFNTIRLDNTIPQPFLSLTDVVLGDYRYRTGERYTMSRQPVQAILSVTGQRTGILPVSEYKLFRPDDPLLLGRSSAANDFLQIVETGAVTDLDTPINVVGESHVLTALSPEFLNRLGVNPLTIRIFNADRTVEYQGPFGGSSADYTIIEGSQTQAVSVRRINTGAIPDGATVLVDYQHGENFAVRYQTNGVIGAVREAIEISRHVTADVVVKEAAPVPVAIQATVVLEKGAQRAVVDKGIRDALANFLARFRTDNPLRQSDVTAIIEETPGVSYVVQPLTRLTRASGTLVVREALSTQQIGDTTLLTAWSTPTVAVWIVTESLFNATLTGGGPQEVFRGVYRNDDLLVLQTVAPSTMGIDPGKAFIIGSEGLSIPGYSDDITLANQGYLTPQARAERRLALTANHVLLSTTYGKVPTSASYTVTYITADDRGAKDLDVGPAEYIVPGDFQFTYDEARENGVRRTR